MTKLGAQRLEATLAAISRVEHGGGARERAALAIALDDWLPCVEAIPPRAGGIDLPATGFALGAWSGGTWWLVPGGRLLVLPDDLDQPVVLAPLSDVDVAAEHLCSPLREAAITAYLGGLPLSEMSGPVVSGAVADLLAHVWDFDQDGRLAVLGALAAAMRPADGWDQAAARLKGGFERGLSDRASAVRTLSARALVTLATGRGPRLAMADPAKILRVLFAVPYRDVHLATLEVLAKLDDESLAQAAYALAEPLAAVAAGPDGATRRLAGQLALRLQDRPELIALADDLEATDAARRLAALKSLDGSEPDLVPALFALVGEGLNDPVPEVREAARAVLVSRMNAQPPDTQERILVALLSTDDPPTAREALDFLHQVERLGPQVTRALWTSLDGPPENRAAVAELLASSFHHSTVEEAVEGHLALLRHGDPVVRQAALRGLVAQPPARPAVREELLLGLMEHLRDPEPSLRVDAASVVVSLGYPRATELVTPLALDPDARARQGLLHVLKAAGKLEALQHAERVARAAGIVLSPPDSADGDARVQWLGALSTVTGESSDRVIDLLVAVLAAIPADTRDAFLIQALAELDAHLLARAGQDDQLLTVCRRLLEPPWPQPEHAVRLAAAEAAVSAVAMDFLWTVYSVAGGLASEAARRALADLAGRPKSQAVVAELEEILRHTEDPAQRDVLQTLIAGH